MLKWCTGEAISVFVTPKNAMTVDAFLCSVPYFCMQHLFPLRSKVTWKVTWWIRRRYLGGNENKSLQLFKQSLLLLQAFLWLVLSCYCTGFLRCQGRKNKGISVQHKVFHPGVLDSCLWGWCSATPLLSTSSLEPLPVAGAGSHLAGAPGWPVRKLCCAPRKTQENDFFILWWKWRTGIHLRR